MYRSIAASPKSSRSAVSIHCIASDDLERLRKRFSGAPGFLADNGEVRIIDAHTMLLGLGKRAEVKDSSMRIAGAKLLRALDRAKTAIARLDSGDALPKDGDRLALGRALGEGIGIANWRVTAFDGTAATRKRADGTLSIEASDRDLHSGIVTGLALSTSVNFAREIAATPPNVCTPAWISQQAKKLAQTHKLTCRVISFAEAKRLGMGGIVSVGMGSEAKPCLVVLDWKPSVKSRAPAKKPARGAAPTHICIVGKTVTYDTGGYSIKVNNGMKGMKYDKCGGTAVLGAMHAIAAAKVPVRVTALLPAAENMVSGDSYRPDDIITLYNGVTVEVTNTDAEGRLVLADALAWACKTLKPTHIVDIATLTGGVVTALGSWCAGLMCTNDDLRGRVERAGTASGDRVWHLPLWNDHREHMRSPHADIINSNPSRLGHPLQGGAFLSFFVDETIPWAHVDIAGVANVDGANDLCSVAGPTGFGVRLLYDLVRGFSA
ncbi:MAG: leucyl aminopeptidase family protein [Phycisphaerae bacterium]|nr:leucyl aminopeptidase family protein [Phycisphaerae bacterium]